MLMAAEFWRKPLASDAHDAHGAGVLEKAIGQLMLMMLMAAGFWREPLAT